MNSPDYFIAGVVVSEPVVHWFVCDPNTHAPITQHLSSLHEADQMQQQLDAMRKEDA